jgi:hypothetical protein
VYLEVLEPQVREAVLEFNRKGYPTLGVAITFLRLTAREMLTDTGRMGSGNKLLTASTLVHYGTLLLLHSCRYQ